MKISGAIFDMDGTLTDSMYVWEDIGIKYALSCGMKPEEDLEEKIRDMSLKQVSEYLQCEYGIRKSVDEIRAGINAIVEPMYRYDVQPKAGVIPVLKELKNRGVKMCVATATDAHLVEMVLSRLDMMKYFSKLFTCTIVGYGKNSPVIYEKALEYLGTPKSETPVFEDALYAAKTAKAAGFPLIGVYDPSSEKDRRELEVVSDFFIVEYARDFKL